MRTLSNHIINFVAMNKSLITIFTFATIVTMGVSCTAQDDNNGKTTIKSEKYEPCCGTPAEVSREITPGVNFFIPNVFTPNADGINDYFYPIYNQSSEVEIIVLYFSVYDSADDKVKMAIFNREEFDIRDIKNYAFDGTYSKDNIRTKWEGQFWYSMSVFVAGKGEFRIKGSACSVVCDEESAIFRDKAGCFFPAQVTTSFMGDNKLSNKETDCFK